MSGDAAIIRLARRLDALMWKQRELLERIRESGHPKAEELAEDLDQQCATLAWPRDPSPPRTPREIRVWRLRDPSQDKVTVTRRVTIRMTREQAQAASNACDLIADSYEADGNKKRGSCPRRS